MSHLQVLLEVLEFVLVLDPSDGVHLGLLRLSLCLIHTLLVFGRPLEGGPAPLGGNDVPGQAVARLVEPWPLLLEQHLVAGGALRVS